MLPTRIKRRRKRYLDPRDSRWLATLYARTKPYYVYDALGRPYTRDTEYPQKEEQHTAAFGYNPRSELMNVRLDEATCAYDYMGRRFEKKVSVNGADTLHERYFYRDYQHSEIKDDTSYLCCGKH